MPEAGQILSHYRLMDTGGFRVLREVPGGRREALQTVGALVPAFGTEAIGGSYELLDDSPAAARSIHYFVEDVDLLGRVTRHGPIPVERVGRHAPLSRSAAREDRS